MKVRYFFMEVFSLFNTDKLSRALGGFADAALIFSEENRRYFTGFSASDGMLLVTAYGALFFTDSRYTEAAAAALGAENVADSAKLYETLNGLFAGCGIGTLAVENDRLTIAEYERLREKLHEYDFNVTSALSNAIADIRIVKNEYELGKIKQAQRIAEDAFGHICGFIRPGMTEKQVSLELDYYMLSHGADALSFETIAVAGAKSSMPHGVPGENVIRRGDFITMDYGAVVDGYHSDMTRTVAVGEPSEKQRSVYATVLDAQKASLAVLKDGISGFDADKAARDIIEKAGYGDCFGHGTGHGVGVEIHEAPSLSRRSKDILRTGHVVTVEPGIYIPGEFGVRIEDMAVITPDGCENLTSSPKELLIL